MKILSAAEIKNRREFYDVPAVKARRILESGPVQQRFAELINYNLNRPVFLIELGTVMVETSVDKYPEFTALQSEGASILRDLGFFVRMEPTRKITDDTLYHMCVLVAYLEDPDAPQIES